MKKHRSSSEATGASSMSSMPTPSMATPPGAGRLDFPVVAIGASAGGVEALKGLLRGLILPEGRDAQAAFVVITHTSPGVKSCLDEVLGNFTSMPVLMVREDQPLGPGVVHTVPSGWDLLLENGVLKLAKPEEGPRHHPIDRFLASLAKDQGPGAIAIILTGTGADGGIGAKNVSDGGGIVLAQDPASAAYPDMPRSAIATGLVDAVLPIGEIGPYLAKLLSSPHMGQGSTPCLKQTPDHDAQISRIIGMLKEHTGHDLAGYKRSTMRRRIQKRLLLSDAGSLAAYVDQLAGNPEERTRLFGDLLIGVTSFFRDEEAFNALRNKALPSIFRGKGSDETVRVWVACCSTGEEAYSVAMLIDEYLEASGIRCPVTIFASDIHQESVAFARRGVYSHGFREGISAQRLKNYFTCTAESCFITPRLRDQIVFAQHNLLQDPPFSRMDLVVCRNFLIYLNPEVQKKALSTIAYALNPGGFLLLGPAETIGELGCLFDPEDKKWRLYRRKGIPAAQGEAPCKTARRLGFDPAQLTGAGLEKTPAPAAMAEKALLKRYGHPAVLLDTNLNALHFRGDIGPYLELAEGEPSHGIFRLATKGLRPHLRSAVHAAQESGRTSVAAGISLGHGRPGRVNLVVDPVVDEGGAVSAFLVVFEPAGDSGGAEGCRVLETATEEALIARYETQLQRAQEDLRWAVRSYETINEELKASNEELISMNEELQSSNEEMDASREELQSLNEELQAKVEELAEANGFVENLLKSTNLATVFLDRNLRVMRFTPETLALFNLLPTDQGRRLAEVKCTFDDDHLGEDSARAMREARMVEREIVTRDGKWYLKRVHPYLAVSGEVAGVVMTFSEVTQLKQAEQVLRRSKEELEALVVERTREIRSWAKFPQENINLVLRVNQGMVITHANRASAPFLRRFGVVVGQGFPEEFAGHIARTIATGETQAFEVVVGEDTLVLHTVLIPEEGYVNIYGQDITERKRLEEGRAQDLAEIRRQRDFLEGLIRNAPIVVGVVEGPGHRYVQANPAYEAIVPKSSRPMVGRSLREVFPDVAETVGKLFESIYTTGQPVHLREFEVPIGPRITWWDADYVPLFAGEGRVSGILVIGREITEVVVARKHAEEEALKWRAVIDSLAEGLVIVADDGGILSINPFGLKMFGFVSEGELPGNIRYFPDLFEVRDLGGESVPMAQWPTIRALEGEVFSGYELEVTRKDTGKSRIARFKGTPVRDRGGRFLFSLLCFEDITEGKRVETALRNARQYIDNIINSMPSKVVCVDSEGLVTHYNDAASVWLACPAGQALGRPLARAFPPLAGQLGNIVEAIRERKSVMLEKQPSTDNGGVQYQDVLIYPLAVKDLEGAVLRIDDVTERVRISELMVQTEKMMSVGGLAAGMAHEINNPLASILQSAQVLLMHADPARESNRKLARECGCTMEALACYAEKRQTLAFLEGIREAGKRAAKIVASMLEFSRKSESRRAPADLNAILDKSLELASRDYDLNKRYDFRHVNIVRDYDPHMGPVPCASNEIEQVVLNLLTNAAQAMADQASPGRTPTIVLRTRRTPGWAVIEVEDNGPGASEAVRGRVFEPFFTTKEPGTGTGLGLSVSYFIITSNHGGTIRMESTPGKGSVFTIRLPLEAGTGAGPGISKQSPA